VLLLVQFVSVWCSVLQCVAACCSVLQCVAVCCSVLQCVAVWRSVLQCGTVCCYCCSVVQCVVVCCSVLQRGVVWCSVLIAVVVPANSWPIAIVLEANSYMLSICCSVLQCVAVCCSVLQCVAVLQCAAAFSSVQTAGCLSFRAIIMYVKVAFQVRGVCYTHIHSWCKPCRTNLWMKWVTSHMSMNERSHVTHIYQWNESRDKSHFIHRYMPHTSSHDISHVAHIYEWNESRDTCLWMKWVTWHISRVSITWCMPHTCIFDIPHTSIHAILIKKARETLELPQTSRAKPVQCYSTHQEKHSWYPSHIHSWHMSCHTYL